MSRHHLVITYQRPARPDLSPVVNDDSSWRGQGLCGTYGNPDDWFPEKKPLARVKRICGACPVRLACLGFALGNGIEFGIWGGLSVDERHELRPQAPGGDHYCRKGLHILEGANVGEGGRCLACRRESLWKGSRLDSYVSGPDTSTRERDTSGRFAAEPSRQAA
jgi:WhiB family redox-sensing transcriptional regulator